MSQRILKSGMSKLGLQSSSKTVFAEVFLQDSARVRRGIHLAGAEDDGALAQRAQRTAGEEPGASDGPAQDGVISRLRSVPFPAMTRRSGAMVNFTA